MAVEAVDHLKRLDKVTYMDHGSSDEEGYQIFTPEFIVNGMIDAIGKKEVLDFSKTILEPTSGDGAFTCRILMMRLKTIKKDFASMALKALSTIYSIEMDEELLNRQRNNIYTIMLDYADKRKITDERFFVCLEDIILTNFVWGMTNTEPNSCVVAYRMPYSGMGGFFDAPVDFYSWVIHDDLSYSKRIEEIEA